MTIQNTPFQAAPPRTTPDLPNRGSDFVQQFLDTRSA